MLAQAVRNQAWPHRALFSTSGLYSNIEHLKAIASNMGPGGMPGAPGGGEEDEGADVPDLVDTFES